MFNPKEVLQQLCDNLISDIVATGVLGDLTKLIDSESSESGCKITVPYWFAVFQDGRKPGSFPPPKEILKYVLSHDLINKIEGFKTPEQLTNAICFTMYYKGNRLYRALNGGEQKGGYNPKRIEFDKIFSENRINSALSLIADNYQSEVTSDIINIFK